MSLDIENEDWVENVRMLVESIGAVVPKDGSLERVRALRHKARGFQRDLWSTFGDMGWLAMLTGEASDGMGLGLREATALCTELGRGLVPEPLIDALFAIRLMESAGAIPDGVLTGDVIMVAAWQASAVSLDPHAGVDMVAGRISGKKIAIDGGAGADLFAVTTSSGVALIPRDSPGLSLTSVPMHDGTFSGEIMLDDVAAELLPCPDMDTIFHDAMLLHSAYLFGASERAFEMTLDYLRVRKQFDVLIGSFQALQHRATEIKVQLELARAAIRAAAAARDLHKEANLIRMTVLRARARAGSLARLVAREAVQMHGAIGYTDEADIGLYVRKAMVGAGKYGPEFRLRSQFMELRETLSENSEVRT